VIAADLDSLDWMAGCWSGEADGTQMEECWLPPAGGMLLGMHRDVLPGGRSFFEFLRIAADSAGVITYWASPRGRPPTPFRLSEVAPARVVFANPAHDHPQRILYWLGKDGRLHARVEGEEGGVRRVEEWSWSRVASGDR
jgi:hypothetical protein